MSFFTSRRLTLFGGTESWKNVETRAVDDTIRGGKSISHFDVSSDQMSAKFSGTLVTEILGAGFASRNLMRRDLAFPVDLSTFDGLAITCELDEKIYSINLKDKNAPTRPDGRLESIIEYKAFLSRPQGGSGKRQTYFLPFASFEPYYRGRPAGNATPLNKAHVTTFNLMCASLFEKQKGDFELTLVEISAVRRGFFARLFSRL